MQDDVYGILINYNIKFKSSSDDSLKNYNELFQDKDEYNFNGAPSAITSK